MIHLTNSQTAVEAFAKSVDAALRAGTVAAGGTLTTIEKDNAAVELFDRFRGLTLTTRQMAPAVARYSLSQLRPICNTAAHNGYGSWDDRTGTMQWFDSRAAPDTLGL